jgi:predicted TPR repeat methyltransferase
MKTAQEMLTEFDRVSTHEELNQVLALLNEFTRSEGAEAPGESDEKLALRDAVADLWRDAAEVEPNEETGVHSELYPWAEMLADKSDRIN